MEQTSRIGDRYAGQNADPMTAMGRTRNGVSGYILLTRGVKQTKQEGNGRGCRRHLTGL